MPDAQTGYDLRRERYGRACWWLDRGVEIVPIRTRSKKLQPGYGPTKAHITEKASARKWFLGTDANLGVVLGGNVGLIVADWDDVEDYQAWRKAEGAKVETLAERTARGYHLFFQGRALVSAASNACEFKTTGVCAVSPSVHPSGVVYRIVSDADIARVGTGDAHRLFPFLSRERDRRQDLGGVTVPRGFTVTRQRLGRSAGRGVVSRIKAARSTVDEMNAAGIALRRGGEDALVGLCPFHDDHHPSLWVNPVSGVWGCNKPSCPAAGYHDVINLRALVRGISNPAAIRDLAEDYL